MRKLLLLIISIVLFSIMGGSGFAQDSTSFLGHLEVITAQNARSIQEVANLGMGTNGLPFWSGNSQVFYFATTAGTWAYNLQDLAHPKKLDDITAPQPLYPTYSDSMRNSQNPIDVSSDGRYAIYQYPREVSGTAYLSIEDKIAGQLIKNISADEPAMRTYSGMLFLPKFYGSDLFFLRTNMLYRWNPTTNQEDLLLSTFPDIFISPNGEFAVTYAQTLPVSDTTTINVYDLREVPAKLIFAQDIMGTDTWNSVAFSPNGKDVATGGNASNTRIWDITSDGIIFTEDKAPDEYQEETVLDLAYSPDGHYLSGCVQGMSFGHAFLRDAATQQDIAIIKGNNSALFCGSVVLHPSDNTIAFGESDGSIRIWNINDLITLQVTTVEDAPRVLRGHTALVTSLAFNHAGTELVSTSSDKTVRVWSYLTGEQLATLNARTAPLWSAYFNPIDNTLAAGGEDGTLRLWDWQKQTNIILDKVPIQEGIYSASTISDLEFNHDGTVLAETRLNGDINLWDVKNGKKLTSINGGRTILDIAFNLNGTLLVSVSRNDTSIRLWGIPKP